MAYVARPADFHAAAPHQGASRSAAGAPLPEPRRRFWRRLIEHILDGRQREAQRVAEQYIARRGKLTDSIEREIAERLMSNRF